MPRSLTSVVPSLRVLHLERSLLLRRICYGAHGPSHHQSTVITILSGFEEISSGTHQISSNFENYVLRTERWLLFFFCFHRSQEKAWKRTRVAITCPFIISSDMKTSGTLRIFLREQWWRCFYFVPCRARATLATKLLRLVIKFVGDLRDCFVDITFFFDLRTCACRSTAGRWRVLHRRASSAAFTAPSI